MKNRKIFVVIPAYNEESVIGDVINGLKREGLNSIIVVNDGSKDNTAKVAKKQGAKVYSLIINRGLGGALSTGLSAALNNMADVIVTCDADGQHSPKDVKRVAEKLLNSDCDVVIGSRLINPEGMPLYRRIGNFGLNIITYILFGVYCTDTQSGLRGFTRNAAGKINIKTNRMEVSSEIINEIGKNKLRIKEIPIKAIYTEYSMKKGQKNINAFNIIYKLIMRKMTR